MTNVSQQVRQMFIEIAKMKTLTEDREVLKLFAAIDWALAMAGATKTEREQLTSAGLGADAMLISVQAVLASKLAADGSL